MTCAARALLSLLRMDQPSAHASARGSNPRRRVSAPRVGVCRTTTGNNVPCRHLRPERVRRERFERVRWPRVLVALMTSRQGAVRRIWCRSGPTQLQPPHAEAKTARLRPVASLKPRSPRPCTGSCPGGRLTGWCGYRTLRPARFDAVNEVRAENRATRILLWLSRAPFHRDAVWECPH